MILISAVLLVRARNLTAGEVLGWIFAGLVGMAVADLETSGCDFGQGYVFSRPLPPNAAEALRRDRATLPA